jgi:hypothetical protein
VTSTFAWLDFDEPARQRMREIVEMLREPGSIDELGLGRIRDAFSDRFFPGTSVLWRRARYLLFVPWTYQLLEREGYRQTTAEAAARSIQRSLRNGIFDSNDRDGLIGLRAADPISPPDVILWSALQQWGVRERSAGTLSQYRATLTRKPRRLIDEVQSDTGSVWNLRIPHAPAQFPQTSCFTLRREDAEFLRDLVLAEDADPDSVAGRRADSLFAELLRVDELVDAPALWWHPLSDTASSGVREAIHHGGCFSDVMYGATLVYARGLAEIREDDDQRDLADEALDAWADRIATERPSELVAWASNLDRFFSVIDQQRLTYLTEQTFVRRWSALALTDPAAVATSKEALVLVRDREAQNKGGKARLTAPRDKDRGEGGSIPAPLTYRWGNALQLARDIREGLEN